MDGKNRERNFWLLSFLFCYSFLFRLLKSGDILLFIPLHQKVSVCLIKNGIYLENRKVNDPAAFLVLLLKSASHLLTLEG